MKKELALLVLTTLVATSNNMVEINETPDSFEINTDSYVTGCQCRSPRPHWKSDDETIV